MAGPLLTIPYRPRFANKLLPHLPEFLAIKLLGVYLSHTYYDVVKSNYKLAYLVEALSLSVLWPHSCSSLKTKSRHEILSESI